MAAQKCKKNFRQKFFPFLNVYYPKNHLTKALNSLDFSRLKGRLSQNPKIGGFRELFLPKIIYKLAPQKFFQKNHPDFEGLETD